MEELKNASFESKTKVNIPSEAKIMKKDFTIRVKEIENGYLIEKSYDIKYTYEGDPHYEYYTKTWFSEENPMSIDIEEPEELADKFD